MKLHEDGTPAEVLRKAADILELEGAWHQGTLYKYEGENPDRRVVAYCLVGGITQAQRLYLLDDSFKVRKYFDDFLKSHTKSTISAPEWNDQPDRTQQEVVDMLRLAAKRWEEDNT